MHWSTLDVLGGTLTTFVALFVVAHRVPYRCHAEEEGNAEAGKPGDRRKRGASAAKAAADGSERKRPRRGQQMEIEYEEEREDVRVPRHQR